MTQDVFVFGTLKKGFPLHEQGLSGAKFLGISRTRQCYPMLIAGPWFAPMMFNEPGIGHHVVGEHYECGEDTIARLDRLESIGIPGNLRVVIDVEPVAGGPICSALAYMKSRKLADPIHSDYLRVYEDRRFIPFDRRDERLRPGTKSH
ncbi:gamma-glutamylcyclotransferase [Rhizobium sp. SEMIA 4085]|uniref:Gamma-glutamylcyclotransferase family protein n=1 Tax=Rhizobium gallicum bv. gallicum R602sp TaxID=1041138 RepID=A0A0B4X395_9HYPH|nr:MULTISPECIES: gamma-glutamylcyclotransferase family protein [Rhizobium]AJD42599.1 AIG2-like family protein [Rhizobium gallicum bv. gallicum R602sp]NNH30488.1 gamma-glutamylcyclotransferase [Rhizobium sp. SEMIA 4085]